MPPACPGRCLLYTSDAADERSSVDLGGRRIIKKKKKNIFFFFFFQAEDGIRDAQESRGLGDVYKRQDEHAGGAVLNAARLSRAREQPGSPRGRGHPGRGGLQGCLLYTSDAADERS